MCEGATAAFRASAGVRVTTTGRASRMRTRVAAKSKLAMRITLRSELFDKQQVPYKSPLELSSTPARGHAELSVGARARTDDSREVRVCHAAAKSHFLRAKTRITARPCKSYFLKSIYRLRRRAHRSFLLRNRAKTPKTRCALRALPRRRRREQTWAASSPRWPSPCPSSPSLFIMTS